MKRFLSGLVLLVSFAMPAGAANKDFPGREVFVNSNPIELVELVGAFDDVLIVDSRSRFEYETLHILGAEHVSFGDQAFVEKVRELRKANPGKSMVFYCNGRTCYKSYKAADRARAAGIEDVRVFDAGVFEWVRAYPEKGVLLGESPVDPEDLITGAQLDRHMIAPAEFARRVSRGSPLVLDIRGKRQRDGVGLFMFKEENISMDDVAKLEGFLGKAKASGRPLLVYDMAGKHVRWFQYYLEDLGLDNYAFMKGGVKAFYREVVQ